MTGTPTTQAEISNQALIMASTSRPTSSSQVKAFDRYLSMVLTQVCDHPNGHITQEAAVRCGQSRAEAELATLPTSVDLEARLSAVAITITTQDRFQCSKGCKFGHKTQAQAQACSTGSPARTAQRVRASIPVSMAPRPTQEPTKATQEATRPTQATQAPKATQEATPKAGKLTSGSQGNTGKA